jgi:hypothetical protein
MKIAQRALVVLTVALLGAMLVPSVQAQQNLYLKRTVVTFSQPVEVPGQILPAGTYTMELVENESYRHIVRFFNADRSRVITTVLAIPNYRLETTDKTVMTFEERPVDAPEALKAWFYPGDSFGQEFVYPKRRAIELAQVTHEPILAMPTETTEVEELKAAPLVAVTPEQEEVPVAEVIQTSPPVAARAAEPATQVAQAQELPKTASLIPLVTMLSLVSLGLAFAIRRFAAQRS